MQIMQIQNAYVRCDVKLPTNMTVGKFVDEYCTFYGSVAIRNVLEYK